MGVLGALVTNKRGSMEILIFWFAFAVLSAIVASSKGRSGFGWLLLGCIFGVFALIAVALMPSLKQVTPNYASGVAPTPDTHVRCPDCREFVFIEAAKCKHCGTKLNPGAVIAEIQASKVNAAPSGAELVGRKIGRMFAKK